MIIQVKPTTILPSTASRTSVLLVEHTVSSEPRSTPMAENALIERLNKNYTTKVENGDGGYVDMLTCKMDECCHTGHRISAFVQCLPRTINDVVNFLCKLFDIRIDMNMDKTDEYELQFSCDGCVSVGMYRFVVCTRDVNSSYDPITDDFQRVFKKHCKRIQFQIQQYTTFVQPTRRRYTKKQSVVDNFRSADYILPPHDAATVCTVDVSSCSSDEDDATPNASSTEFVYKRRVTDSDLVDCSFHSTTASPIKFSSPETSPVANDVYLVVYKPVRKIDSRLICDIDLCLKLL